MKKFSECGHEEILFWKVKLLSSKHLLSTKFVFLAQVLPILNGIINTKGIPMALQQCEN